MVRTNRRLICAVVLLCFIPLSARAQSPRNQALTPGRVVAVDRAVQAELTRQGIVGASIGIIQNGQIVYVQGYGLADRESATQATSKTVFNWASNSKPLAAVAAIQLVEKKQLDLDVDIRKYVPDFPDKGKPLTCRRLLAHQSGMPHYANGIILATTREYSQPQPFLDPVLALNKFDRSPLIFAPGDKVSYSSYAYVLLSAVIQEAGKQPFAVQIENRIAKPLAMSSLQIDVDSQHQVHWATGYIKDRQGVVVRSEEEAHYWKHGAGGYKSNVEDFAKWADALINRKLVSEESEKLMWTRQKLNDGTVTTWGLGFTIEEQGGLKVSHNGKQDEVTTRMVLYPRGRNGVVVMCNCGFGDVGAISTAIYKALNENSTSRGDD